MLEAYIIERLRLREAEKDREGERPRLDLPLPPSKPPEEPASPDEGEAGTGVIIIDL